MAQAVTETPLTIVMDDIPPDETPVDIPSGESSDDRPSADPSNWFDPEYPFSTEIHPYGYFPNSDGTPDYGRPRKRRPHGRRKSAATDRMPASSKQAEMAANVLKTLNSYVAMSLSVVGLRQSSQELVRANEEFRDMAYQALLSDPDLCNRILTAGAMSGKAQLTMAYVMLGGAMAPCVMLEIKEKRSQREDDNGETFEA